MLLGKVGNIPTYPQHPPPPASRSIKRRRKKEKEKEKEKKENKKKKEKVKTKKKNSRPIPRGSFFLFDVEATPVWPLLGATGGYREKGESSVGCVCPAACWGCQVSRGSSWAPAGCGVLIVAHVLSFFVIPKVRYLTIYCLEIFPLSRYL